MPRDSLARLATETIGRAFATGCFSATTLQAYERAWHALLADELALALLFRQLYDWSGDRQMDGILQDIARHGLKDLMRHKANFDGHRELLVDLRRCLPPWRVWRQHTVQSLRPVYVQQHPQPPLVTSHQASP